MIPGERSRDMVMKVLSSGLDRKTFKSKSFANKNDDEICQSPAAAKSHSELESAASAHWIFFSNLFHAKIIGNIV